MKSHFAIQIFSEDEGLGLGLFEGFNGFVRGKVWLSPAGSLIL